MLRALAPCILLALPLTAPMAASDPGGRPPLEATDPPTFEGLWESSYGRMRLSLDGEGVRGTYAFASGSAIEGQVDGQRMTFRYTEPSAAGEGWFQLAEDGQTFRGRWRADGSTQDRPWSGRRVQPVPGRVWLVILEANWETSLAEEEYAFGDMLRAYFQMAPARHIEVRQRSFHDEADLFRQMREVTYLDGPVVLLISTHGTPAGITVGGATIGADTLARALAPVRNLELLHLSGCSMMNGEVPGLIHAGLEPSARFPISGYSTPVAWDASALSDFTFLTFLLVRRLSPAEAVRQTHLAAPYTLSERPQHGERGKGSGFRRLGLALLDPGAE